MNTVKLMDICDVSKHCQFEIDIPVGKQHDKFLKND